MLDPCTVKHLVKELGNIDRNGADKDGLTLCMSLLYLLDNSLVLLGLCLVYGIIMIHPDDRLVGRDLDNVHPVDITELLLLGEGGTGHAGLLFVLVEEVLEGNSSKGHGLTLYLHVLLRLNGLVETVGIAAPRHYPSRKVIDYQDLVILYYIILITVHEIVCSKSKDHIVLYLEVCRIRKVFNPEELLNLPHTFGGKAYVLVLLVNYEVSGLLPLNAHDGVHLGIFGKIIASLKLVCKYVAHLIELCGLP